MKISTLTLSLALAALLAACGKEEPPPALQAPESAPAQEPAPAPAEPAQAPQAAAPQAAAPADAALGEGIYKKTCALCHAAGVGGAPKVGDAADWGKRGEQGMDVLYKHAMEGFTGEKGMMPPRGGSTNLTDEEVKAAVDFMVAKSK